MVKKESLNEQMTVSEKEAENARQSVELINYFRK
jgi:hypothetical protein